MFVRKHSIFKLETPFLRGKNKTQGRAWGPLAKAQKGVQKSFYFLSILGNSRS